MVRTRKGQHDPARRKPAVKKRRLNALIIIDEDERIMVDDTPLLDWMC